MRISFTYTSVLSTKDENDNFIRKFELCERVIKKYHLKETVTTNVWDAPKQIIENNFGNNAYLGSTTCRSCETDFNIQVNYKGFSRNLGSSGIIWNINSATLSEQKNASIKI